MAATANAVGDLFAEVHALLPARLSPRQRELVEELARTLENREPGRKAS